MATNERDDYESPAAEAGTGVMPPTAAAAAAAAPAPVVPSEDELDASSREEPHLEPEPQPEPDDDATVVQPSNPPVDKQDTIRHASRIVVTLYAAAAVVFLIRAAITDESARDHAQAAAFGIGMVALALLCLHLLDRPVISAGQNKVAGDHQQVGIFRPLISDGRFSTSLTQLGLWTIAAGTGFGYLLGLSIFSTAKLATVMPDARWDEYLILLGGPFAAAVLAKGITTYKIENGTMQATTPDKTRLSQVATNEQGHVDLVDAQYLLFNVVALGYFVVKLIESNTLPDMPGALLALTSSTAGLYVGNKAAFRNRPTVTSISPVTVQVGKALTVHGANFMPDGSVEGRVVTVSLSGHGGVIYPRKASDTMVRFTVPTDTTAGWQTVVITSTAGVATTEFAVHVIDGTHPPADKLAPPAR
jgi:hypothetical protein